MSFLQELVDRCAALSAKPHVILNLVESMSKLADTYHDVEGMLQDIKELIEVSSVCISYKMFCLCLCLSFCVQCLLRSMCNVYRVSQEECAILRESVPYVKLYRYNPEHLYPKLNGYGDNGERSLKV